LDSTICAPLRYREELEGFVHRPQFKLVTYTESGSSPSSSLQSLKEVVASLNIEEDPWVINQRDELRRLEPGPRRERVDQNLSRALDKQSTFTHRGLRDFERAADEICAELGEWATDWYIEQVCKEAASAGGTFPEFSFSWTESERKYLLKNLARVKVAPVPDDVLEDIPRRSSEKVEKLVDVLLSEKAVFEGKKMEYRGLIFVTRRDAVLALTEILARHPRTRNVFSIGSLLGESGSFRRHSFLDITRRLLRQPASKTLADFRIGELNLIVATAVAEEGLDIQACCNVVRWDFPANMVSWAQSRGRARQAHSSFVLMLSNSLAFARTVRDWQDLENQMATLYHTRMELQELHGNNEVQPMDDDDDDEPFTVAETG
jgi:endoribonuclease Dicer